MLGHPLRQPVSGADISVFILDMFGSLDWLIDWHRASLERSSDKEKSTHIGQWAASIFSVCLETASRSVWTSRQAIVTDDVMAFHVGLFHWTHRHSLWQFLTRCLFHVAGVTMRTAMYAIGATDSLKIPVIVLTAAHHRRIRIWWEAISHHRPKRRLSE